jgi:hypothetical protein
VKADDLRRALGAATTTQGPALPPEPVPRWICSLCQQRGAARKGAWCGPCAMREAARSDLSHVAPSLRPEGLRAAIARQPVGTGSVQIGRSIDPNSRRVR